MRKLFGDGTPEEAKVILGWLLNTRLFRIYLPEHKATMWTRIIRDIIRTGHTNAKEMDSVVGINNHIGYIMPHSRYFLNRLRWLKKRCETTGPSLINDSESRDLILWTQIIHHASTKGISLNNITLVRPHITIWTDASPFGFGFMDSNGLCWRWQIPSDLFRIFTINFLEFAASYFGILSVIRHYPQIRYICILAKTDSSSCLGWFYKASFNPETHEVHNRLARALAELLLSVEGTLYPRHIPGKLNIIPDSLSRDFHIDMDLLLYVLTSLFPHQTPNGLHAVPPPNEIYSFLISLRDIAIPPKASRPEHPQSNLGYLIDGNYSWQVADMKMNGWKAMKKQNLLPSSQHLRQLFAEINSVPQANCNYEEELSLPPLATYVRPSGRTYGATLL